MDVPVIRPKMKKVLKFQMPKIEGFQLFLESQNISRKSDNWILEIQICQILKVSVKTPDLF